VREEIVYNRRRFLGAAAMTIAAAKLTLLFISLGMQNVGH